MAALGQPRKREPTMTKDQKVIRNKVGLLELAKQLGNVSQACKIMGYSRDSFYRFKELYDQGGELALQEISRQKPIVKNRVAAEIEQAVVEVALEQPTWDQVRVSNELRKKGLSISPFGVRCVWQRPSAKHEEAVEGAGGQGRSGGPDPDRGAGGGARESQVGQAGPWGVRERMPRLLRRPGHLLCRDAQGRGMDLPADLHRHLRQGGL